MNKHPLRTMKRNQLLTAPLRSVAVATCLLALVLHCQGKTFPFPPMNEAVEKAVAPANLRAVAARTTDPEVWMGLSFLAQPGDPVRPELSAMAVKAKPEFASLAIVLANAMDGVDEQSIAELIRRDPANALGYYLLGNQLSKPGTEKESLEAFRKGATCPELRLYGGAVSNVLFKALSALNLKGRDRLCASSWMATRWANFEILSLQSQGNVLQRMAQDADIGTRKEISDLMLAVAGHLIDSDFQNRVFGERTLQKTFRLKADIAASENSPTMSGYVGVVQALVSTSNVRSSERRTPLAVAQFLPGRIWRGFVVLDPERAKTNLIEMKDKPPGTDPAFDKLYANWAKASKALIDATLPDQDEIIGAYFCGHLPPRTNASGPWAASAGTCVESLVSRKPGLFKAAVLNEQAMDAINEVHNSAAAGTKQTGSPKDAATAAKDECINNLRLIDGAKQEWALELGKRATDTPSWSDIQPYFGRGPNGAIPKCPLGGTYTIGTVGAKPECSIAGHVLE
jgi:hypothetical protein